MHSIPSTTWRALSQRPSHPELPYGLDALWDRCAGFAGRLLRRRSRCLRQAALILDMSQRYFHISNLNLRAMISQLHERFRLGRDTAYDQNLAFALICEVTARELGLRPFLVQVAGALATASGCITEMATGEGKTLVTAMPAVLAGWRGRGCHVVTANEYLAARDAALMAPVYKFCGLKVASIAQGATPAERKRAYNADITYCTSKEIAADFLRDQLLIGHLHGLPQAILETITRGSDRRIGRLVQRGLECAIVDEADAVLIDEAVTPLLLSGEGANQDYVDAYKQASRLAEQLDSAKDYRTDKRYREVGLTEAGKQLLGELAAPLGGPWAGARRREELVVQALTAREFFVRDEQYIIEDGKVVIIDKATGRRMPDRTWRDGLHQAIEAKEGLGISLPKTTLARISFQRFFRRYRKLSGLTGTGAEAQCEFWQIYHLPLVVIPTHRKCSRLIMPDRIFTSANAKWAAVVKEVKRIHKTGRPILIGTRSIAASEYLSRRLTSEGLKHQVLNAVHHEKEAQIISNAGQRGCITVATNMAGRGTDIRLGEDVAIFGGLHVIATERHESGRIDRQLYGRCARQGDPGSAQVFVSLEDELLQRHARPETIALARFYGSADKEISSSFCRWLIDTAQRRAERKALRQRKEVLYTDRWLDEQLGFAGMGF
ncbi:MAG: prepilin peptidase [Deltaproteobacteria bacterium]|nr:prepilin peptidase [Deltaproteobacteria bacterium]MBW1993334.1 prepilin peptidase [Deltaproteobacteria bacterium]